MRTEEEIKARIKELEAMADELMNWLNESEHSELMTLYWVLRK